MSLLDDVNRLLEARLEEFMRKNPHLELQAMEEKLQQQLEEVQRLVLQAEADQKRTEAQILTLAKEIQRWDERIKLAKQAGREDLVTRAQQRQVELLRQGNQAWGQMEVLRDRYRQGQELYEKIAKRRQEVQAMAKQAQAARTTQSSTPPGNPSSADPLEETFRHLEAELELQEIRRQHS